MSKCGFVPVVSVLACLLGVSTADTLEKVDLKKLLDPATRQAEVTGLLERQDAASKYKFKRSDFRLVTCPQGQGKDPLQVLLVDFGEMIFDHAPPRDAYESDGLDELFPPEKEGIVDRSPTGALRLERLEKRVVTVFDPEGREIRPFGGATMIESGFLTDFNGDGIVDRLDHTNYGMQNSLTVQVLELRSVEREPRPILSVLFNWHPREAEKANGWDYECFDDDKDGLIEIGFGPKDQERRREVVFRWNKASATYVADNASKQPHVRVLANSDIWTQLKELQGAGGVRYPLIDEKSATVGDTSKPPAPYEFQSLKGSSDEEIARAMGGKPKADSFHPSDAPDTRLPEGFWEMEPKAAALALVEANRTPEHLKMVRLKVDDRNEVRPPESGWLAYHYQSSTCYVSSSSLTVLRFGIEEPFIFQSGSSRNGVVGANPLADRTGHALRMIRVSKEEACFLSETLFWLDRIRSRSLKKDRFGSHMSSTADGSSSVDFQAIGQPPRRVEGTLWVGSSLAARWDDDYDQNTCVNFADFFLTDALPKHLAGRWEEAPLEHRDLATPLEERLVPRETSDERDRQTALIRSAFERHRSDPWPVSALALLVNCAGEGGLIGTLPMLEELDKKIGAPGSGEVELEKLEERFKGQFGPPNDPEGKKQWERLQSLREQLDFDLPYQLREPLARAIKQLRAISKPDLLLKLADGNDASTTWALQQLQLQHPEDYADTLIARFLDADLRSRKMIFPTLAAAHPAGAKRLRGMLNEQQAIDLAIELAGFESKDEPALARSRIPALLDIFRDESGARDYGERGPAIELLTALPLEPQQQVQFEGLLLAELKSPRRNEFKMSIYSWVVGALVKCPNPDRHWDALVGSSRNTTQFGEFGSLLDALVTLTVAKPDVRTPQLVEFLRPHFVHQGGMMNDLFRVALALDLRPLTPEIERLASKGPDVEEGDCAEGWGGGFTGPGNERYHLARHIAALWKEPDADTRAKMWTVMVLDSPSRYSGQSDPISKSLRARYLACLSAASPSVGEAMKAKFKSIPQLVPDAVEGSK